MKKNSSLNLILVIILILSFNTITAQSDQELYNNYKNACINRTGKEIPDKVIYSKKRARKWLEALGSMANSKNTRSKYCAIDGIFRILNAKDLPKSVGQIGVNVLVKKLNTLDFVDYIVQRIDDLPADFFLENHKSSILKLAQNKKTPHRKLIINLLALLQYKGAFTLIREELKNPKLGRSQKFNYHTALAANGDKKSTEWLLTLIKKKKINDDTTYEIVDKLVNTKQRPLIQWVIEGLYDTENRCYSRNPDIEEKIHCGYRIIESLAPVIKGFPYKVEDGGLITDDYEKALEDVRNWFKSNLNFKIK